MVVSQTLLLTVKSENPEESSKTKNMTDSRRVNLTLPMFFPTLLYIAHMYEVETKILFCFLIQG